MRICSLTNSVPFKKNPFLGRELICFANPTQPPEGEVQSETTAPLAEKLMDVAPGKQGEPEDVIERHQRWVTLLGPYNQIQVEVKHLDALKKQLSDPALVNKPEFQARLQGFLAQEYKKMEKVLGVLPHLEDSLRETIQRNAVNQLNTDRAGAMSVADNLTTALIKQRKLELAKIGETLKEDLGDRIKTLHKKWKDNPPAGYEEYQAGWLEYTDSLLETIEGQDLSNLDDGTTNSPVGSKLLEEAEVWWDKLSHMEDSYVDFTSQDTSQFTDANVKAVYEQLKEKRKTILTDTVVSDFRNKADEVLAKGAQTRTLIEGKMRELKGDPLNAEDIKTLEDSLKVLDEKMKDLSEKKNINAAVDEVLTGKEELTQFKVPVTPETPDGYVSIPKGLEGQVEALGRVPMSTEGRRQVIRTMLESMEAVEKNLHKYKEYAEVTLPQGLIDMDLFQKGLDVNRDGNKTEIILVNPFATLGHLWHSYSEAVKGNVETNEKRGAGFFQRDATKIFNHMSKIPVVGNLSVIKSLTELSVNGAVEAEHAEHHRISEYEKSYEAVPPDHLAHMAEEASDEWELQGCLKVLAKAGRINWNAEWLFKALNKYQKKVHLPEDRHWHMRNITESNELMRQAFVYIYRDEDVYRNLRNTNLSSYESKMGDYNKQWGGIAAQDGALKKRGEEILALYKSDHDNGVHNSKANPIEFESIIRYGVEQGKMKMEDRLNLLVRGVALGLLSFDRGINATDKNNNYPPYDFFETGTGRGDKPTYDDVLEWAEYAKSPQTWDYFMHKADGVMNNNKVNERLIKTMTQGSHRLDHDDAAGIAGYLTMDITKDLLKVKTQGGYGMPVTGLKSLSTGNEFWLRMFSEEYEKRSPADRKNEMIRFASQFMMMDGIMNERAFKGQDFYRLKAGPDRSDPPRFGRDGYSKVFMTDPDTKKVKSGYNVNAGTADIIDYVAKKIMMLDPGEPNLLHKLLNNEIKTDPQAKEICAQLEAASGGKMFDGAPPTKIDELYAALPKYFEYILEDPSKMKMMTDSIRSEHVRHTSAMDHDLHHPIEHIREAAKTRGLTGVEPPHVVAATPVGGGPSSQGSTY